MIFPSGMMLSRLNGNPIYEFAEKVLRNVLCLFSLLLF